MLRPIYQKVLGFMDLVGRKRIFSKYANMIFGPKEIRVDFSSFHLLQTFFTFVFFQLFYL